MRLPLILLLLLPAAPLHSEPPTIAFVAQHDPSIEVENASTAGVRVELVYLSSRTATWVATFGNEKRLAPGWDLWLRSGSTAVKAVPCENSAEWYALCGAWSLPTTSRVDVVVTGPKATIRVGQFRPLGEPIRIRRPSKGKKLSPGEPVKVDTVISENGVRGGRQWRTLLRLDGSPDCVLINGAAWTPGGKTEHLPFDLGLRPTATPDCELSLRLEQTDHVYDAKSLDGRLAAYSGSRRRVPVSLVGVTPPVGVFVKTHGQAGAVDLAHLRISLSIKPDGDGGIRIAAECKEDRDRVVRGGCPRDLALLLRTREKVVPFEVVLATHRQVHVSQDLESFIVVGASHQDEQKEWATVAKIVSKGPSKARRYRLVDRLPLVTLD